MATGDTAPPPLTIQPPPIEPLSDDNSSSPLSDVEDKDADPDELNNLNHRLVLEREPDVSSLDDLSDANDTEAETERLYDTPKNPTRQKDVVFNQSAEGRVYERTPSKLRQQQSTVEDANDDDDDEPLSDADISMTSSPPAQETKPPNKQQSPILDILAEAANQEAESRKRKRSAPTEPEPQEPLRKRNGSVPPQGRKESADDTAAMDENDSSKTQSGEHSADEAPTVTVEEAERETVEEAPSDHEVPPPKLTRSGSKKKKSSEEAAEPKKTADEPHGRAGAEEDQTHTGDDEPMADEVDEEAEAAHRNEEERMTDTLETFGFTAANHVIIVERKKAAFEQLAGIEKRFNTFRDRYAFPCSRLRLHKLTRLYMSTDYTKNDFKSSMRKRPCCKATIPPIPNTLR